ncbi:GntR family transcriptional regulator [Sporolactobacillus sp. THM7-7]|nr:GntR family transcriptional regulator [Sporolactobacillus sp. THM7-7]
MDIILSNTVDLPIYRQIKHQISEQILSGGLRDGERLPSIRHLAKELKISVITTKRAYEELEKEGFIDTVPGRGSFVSLRDKDALKKQQSNEVRKRLKEIVREGKKYDLTQEQMIQWIKQCYGED